MLESIALARKPSRDSEKGKKKKQKKKKKKIPFCCGYFMKMLKKKLRKMKEKNNSMHVIRLDIKASIHVISPM